MTWTRAAFGSLLALALGATLVSGGSSADPRTPAPLPGEPPPFLGQAVVGNGRLTAAIDAYGDVVDLRVPGPAGRALIENPAARQAAGSVPTDTGIVTRVAIGARVATPLWRADWVRERYLPGTNVLRTVAGLGAVRVTITTAAAGARLARCVRVIAPRGVAVEVKTQLNLSGGARIGCASRERGEIADSASADRRWLQHARPLDAGAPAWAEQMYRRSLLVLRALTDRRTGAVVAGARDRWAYVWPRDAAAASLAYAAAGYRGAARKTARFLLGLDLNAAARFGAGGAPVGGRGAEGDAWGWVAAAAARTGLRPPAGRPLWRNRTDYQEQASGDLIANAISSAAEQSPPRGAAKSPAGRTAAMILANFNSPRGLVRRAADPTAGWDSAAAWAVRPFGLARLYPAARASLELAIGHAGRFGIVPSEDWSGKDPWTAPTAWSAWSLAALGERRQALRLLGDLRRAATPAGLLPERVGARTGIPVSTTPLTWSHAFTILTLRQLWPTPQGRFQRESQ